MKKSILCSIVGLLAVVAGAQNVPVERHPRIPAACDAVFVDQVSAYAGQVLKSAYGQYFGQITIKGDIYGFGTFFTDQDGEVYGQFRNGDFIVGIKMGGHLAKVGTADHYTAYDLYTSEPLYVAVNGQRVSLGAANRKAWRFVQMNYRNGDKYVGEAVDGRRDGYGIYYYANGDYTYGRYSDNAPTGYGALFKTNGRIVIQCWDSSEAK